jgi:Ca-activated chloride channel family protein
MQDGTYTVRLVLRDRAGYTYREFKTFVIASKPPVIQVKLDKTRYHRGQTINLKASASQSTRTLVARLEGVLPVALNWDARAGINAGSLVIPEQTVPGNYKLTVTAEDIAHNIGTQEVQIEILP